MDLWNAIPKCFGSENVLKEAALMFEAKNGVDEKAAQVVAAIYEKVPQVVAAIQKAPQAIATSHERVPQVIAAIYEKVPQVVAAIHEKVPQAVAAIHKKAPQVIAVIYKKAAQAGAAIYEKVPQVVVAVWGFAEDHPVVCASVALGILVILAPRVLKVLGFGGLGPIEGTFAAGWQSTYGGSVPAGSLFSFFQRLGMV